MFKKETEKSGKTIIENARLAREERALQKRREQAAFKIQQHLRGFLIRFVFWY